MTSSHGSALHVICGLTVKFNHHRVKVYHVICLANLHIHAISDHSDEGEVELGLTHHFLCSAAAGMVLF